MAVLARLLMLLAAGPLLLPTGFCVCKADWSVGPSRVSVAVQPDAPPVAKKKGCCSWCAAPAGEPTAAVAPQKIPPPADDHMPGCPASPGADSLKWVEPTPQLVAVLALTAVVALLVAEPTPAVATPLLTSSNWPSAPPLYLSHCALVL